MSPVTSEPAAVRYPARLGPAFWLQGVVQNLIHHCDDGKDERLQVCRRCVRVDAVPPTPVRSTGLGRGVTTERGEDEHAHS